MQDFDVLCLESLFFFNTLLRVLKQSISSSITFLLTIINPEVVIREFLGPTNLFGAQALCVHESAEVVVVNEYKHLILRVFQIIPPSLESLNNS